MKYSNQSVVVHCSPKMLPLIEELEYNWSYSPKFGSDEVDLYLTDIITESLTTDPDVDLCEHYGLNYDLVHCIEAV